MYKNEWMSFNSASNNKRKIILATDVAEKSITLPDVKYGKQVYVDKKDLSYHFLNFFLTFVAFQSLIFVYRACSR